MGVLLIIGVIILVIILLVAAMALYYFWNENKLDKVEVIIKRDHLVRLKVGVKK